MSVGQNQKSSVQSPVNTKKYPSCYTVPLLFYLFKLLTVTESGFQKRDSKFAGPVSTARTPHQSSRWLYTVSKYCTASDFYRGNGINGAA